MEGDCEGREVVCTLDSRVPSVKARLGVLIWMDMCVASVSDSCRELLGKERHTRYSGLGSYCSVIAYIGKRWAPTGSERLKPVEPGVGLALATPDVPDGHLALLPGGRTTPVVEASPYLPLGFV